jgi:hypothetical protein
MLERELAKLAGENWQVCEPPAHTSPPHMPNSLSSTLPHNQRNLARALYSSINGPTQSLYSARVPLSQMIPLRTLQLHTLNKFGC